MGTSLAEKVSSDEFVLPPNGAGTSNRRMSRAAVLWVSADSAESCSPSTDVYMLGSMAFELLTGGQRPFYWMTQVRFRSHWFKLQVGCVRQRNYVPESCQCGHC